MTLSALWPWHDQLPVGAGSLSNKHQLCRHRIISLSPRRSSHSSLSFSHLEVKKIPFIFSDIPVCSPVPVTSYVFEWLMKISSHRLSIHSLPSLTSPPSSLSSSHSPSPNKCVSRTSLDSHTSFVLRGARCQGDVVTALIPHSRGPGHSCLVPNKVCGQVGGKERRSSAESVKEGSVEEVDLK